MVLIADRQVKGTDVIVFREKLIVSSELQLLHV